MPLPPSSLSFEETGGLKSDYTQIVNSQTDRSADEVNAVFGSVSQMSRTNTRAYVKFSMILGAYVVTDWDAVWKASTTTLPIITKVTTGKYLITLPATVLDVQGNSIATNFKAVQASYSATTDIVYGSTLLLEPQILTANTVRLWCSVGGAASDPTGIYVTLMVI